MRKCGMLVIYSAVYCLCVRAVSMCCAEYEANFFSHMEAVGSKEH